MIRIALKVALLCSLVACDELGMDKEDSSVKNIICSRPFDESFVIDHTSFTKSLCEDEKKDGLEMYEQMCADGYEIMCERLARTDCDRYQDALGEVEKCRASNSQYAVSLTLTIDIESAKNQTNSYADFKVSNCWMDKPEVNETVHVKVTPENISFNTAEHNMTMMFNRKTLTLSWGGEDSLLLCRVEGVKPDNKI